MKDISKLYDYFQRYHDGEMNGDEKAAFERKLKDDQRMRRAYADFELLLQTAADKDALAMRKELKSFLKKRRKDNTSWIRTLVLNPWSAAAAALFVLVIAVYFIYINLFVDERAISQKMTSSLEQINWDDPAYSIPDEYVDLLKMDQRSNEFRFISPADSMVFVHGEKLKFYWKYAEEDLGLDILDAEGAVIFHEGKIAEVPFEMKASFDNGAYLFRVRNNEEALHWGIFFVVSEKEH